MIDIGVASPSAHGHAMIEHGDRVDERVRAGAARARRAPRRRTSATATHDDRRHELARRRCRRAAGSARGCAAPRRPCCTICASSVSAPTRSARITSEPVPLTVPPISAVAGALLDRHRLAGDHRLVDRARALERRRRRPGPSRRAARAGDRPTARPRAARPPRRRPSRDAARGLRREAEQRADRGAGAAARAQLEHLAEQHERHDHGGRLEVDADAARDGRGTRRERRRGAASRPRCSRTRRATPSAISVNMLRLRVTSERHARTKNGQPPHSTTGVASASSIHARAAARGRAARGAGSISPIASANSGAVSSGARPRSAASCRRSSGSSSSSATPIVERLERHAADRAGAGPASRTISGCIGHV